jgi:hypothetical protein
VCLLWMRIPVSFPAKNALAVWQCPPNQTSTSNACHGGRARVANPRALLGHTGMSTSSHCKGKRVHHDGEGATIEKIRRRCLPITLASGVGPQQRLIDCDLRTTSLHVACFSEWLMSWLFPSSRSPELCLSRVIFPRARSGAAVERVNCCLTSWKNE